MDINIESFKEQCRQLAIRDRHHDLLELMQDAPPELIQADEDMAFWHALCLLSTVRYVEGKKAADAFIQRHATPDNPLGLGRSHLLRSHLHIMDGDTEASYQQELKIHSIIPKTAYHERLRSWATIDTMAGHMGDTIRMEQAIIELAELRNNLPFDQSWWYSFVVPNRADILAKRGLLDKAEALLMAQLASVPPEEIAIIKLRLAVLALERQDPTKAREWLDDIDPGSPTTYWSTEAFLIASQVQRLHGDAEGAVKLLQQGLAERGKDQIRSEFFRIQMQLCELWIQEGEIELAEAWISLASKALDPWPRTFGHPIPNMILAQLNMAKGQWAEAIRLLETLRAEGVSRGHTGLLVGIYAHLANAHAARGEESATRAFVQLAIDSAAHGNFAKSLTVFGKPIHEVLTHMPTTSMAPEPDVAIQDKCSRLSEREREVLELVAEGKRNHEIADTLYLSLSTVKNHLRNIHRRLGVSNRRDAVRVAQSMGILPGDPGNQV